MKYKLIVFGCQMNRSDAERIETVMNQMGYDKSENEELNDADIAIVVACSIRQHAIDRIYGLKKRFDKIKKVRPFTTILTGCVLDADKKNMEKFFDIIFNINDLGELPKLLDKSESLQVQEYLSIQPVYENNFQAYIPITKGCNQFCHFCVVPYTRGREVYRDPDEIVSECRRLVEVGYKEITLLGQTVNSYNHKKANFSKLLQMIDAIEGDYWIRFVSSHPNFFSDDVIDTWKKGTHLTPYLHLAVQSGDNEMLQKMNRKYSIEKFKDVVAKIRAVVPGVAVSTDIIVGYSGETEEHFLKTMELFREMRFDMAYISKYSIRKGTLGEKLHADDVSYEEKKRRDAELNLVLKEVAHKNNKKLVGKNMKILVESHSKGYWMGKSDSFKTVKIQPNENDENFAGQFVDVKIVEALPWGLLAERV